MLLSPEAVFKDKPLKQLAPFFKNKLGVVQRARWRWIFPEPTGAVEYPRQRARNEIMDSVGNWDHADQLSSEASDRLLPPHNRTSPVFHVGPKAAAEWAAFCLVSTNNVYNKVPPPPVESPTSFNSIAVWLKMIQLAHSEALLKPGAMHAIESWAQRSTERQRSALSNLLLLLSDFVATGGSSLLSETKIKFGPKAIQPREAAAAGESTLGRPSTAPIVSAVHRKLEERLKAEDEAAARRAEAMMSKRVEQGLRTSASRAKHPAYGSSIPMKWPMKEPNLVTSTQVRRRPPTRSPHAPPSPLPAHRRRRWPACLLPRASTPTAHGTHPRLCRCRRRHNVR